MSFAVENPIQTPSSGRVASGGIVEPPLLVLSLEDTPDPQVSIESQASYDFWGAEQQSRNNRSLTPTTPLSPENHQIGTCLSTPQSTRLKKSKSDSQLSGSPFNASESDTGKRGRSVKVEPQGYKEGWLFGDYTTRLYQNKHVKGSQSLNRASSANWLDSAEADFWATGTEKNGHESFVFSKDLQFDFNFSRQRTPHWEEDSMVLRSGTRTGVTAKRRQASRTRFKRKDSVQTDSPTPSPSKDSHPLKAKVKQLMTGSEAEVITESKYISAESALGRMQQQSDSLVQIQCKAVCQWTSETDHGVSKSEFSERRSTRTTASSSELSKVLPFNIRERLSEDSHRCVASQTRNPHPRCLKKADGPREAVIQYLNTLSGTYARSDYSNTIQYIEGLINLALCKAHRKVATEQLKTWRATLDGLSKSLGQPNSQRDCPSTELTALTLWIEALTGATVSAAETHIESVDQVTFSDGASQPIPKILISSVETSTEVTEDRKLTSVDRASETITSTVQRRKLTKVQYLHYVQDFQRYMPESISHLSISQTLEKALTRPLSAQDQKSGHIYIYWFRGNFGYLKIGITSRDINTRLDEWVRQCKHEVEGHYTEDMLRQVAVPHVYRVEALVHRELRDVRYQEVACKGCGRSHKEWFRVPVGHAAKVVKKWSDWMMKNPYEPDSGREGAEWKLKGSIEDDGISSLCQPLELPMPAPGVRHNGWRPLRRSSRSTAGKRRVS